jgi:hypothetical protein
MAVDEKMGLVLTPGGQNQTARGQLFHARLASVVRRSFSLHHGQLNHDASSFVSLASDAALTAQ